MAILFITHFLDQTYQIADRITILKNGEFVGEHRASELPKLDLIAKMLGKELSDFSFSSEAEDRKPADPAAASAGSLLRARGLGRRGAVAPIDLDLEAGEVLGLAGLLGSGRTETARLLFGIDKADCGEIEIRGKPAQLGSPRAAMMRGIGFCSEDRKSEGIFAELSIRENLILALQTKQGALKFIAPKKQAELADRLIRELGIKTPNSSGEAKQLSGGNQQKVMLARWLATEPDILILDEPTRGIDVGAKLEIMEQILALSRAGLGLVFISSEFEEVLRCSERIAVFKDKALIAQLSGPQMTEADIMRTIAGGR